jgi:uncharacterized protein YbbK (DUF523 family)/uncharacterized protein YbgA (DUF1722 family)
MVAGRSLKEEEPWWFSNFFAHKVRLGISSCLQGHNVRYDGGHKRNHFLMDKLNEYVHWIDVCPEVELGLPVPREPIQLESDPLDPKLMAIDSRNDLTGEMHDFCDRRVRELMKMNLHGYVLKGKSPSCGMKGLPVFGLGETRMVGIGLFARTLMETDPGLPVEEAESLGDPMMKHLFLERIFACAALHSVLEAFPGLQTMERFQKTFELAFDMRGEGLFTELSCWLNQHFETDSEDFLRAYRSKFMGVMNMKPDHESRIRVLQRVRAFSLRELSKSEFINMDQIIESCCLDANQWPRTVWKVRAFLKRLPATWPGTQSCFNPFPEVLMLETAEM